MGNSLARHKNPKVPAPFLSFLRIAKRGIVMIARETRSYIISYPEFEPKKESVRKMHV